MVSTGEVSESRRLTIIGKTYIFTKHGNPIFNVFINNYNLTIASYVLR